MEGSSNRVLGNGKMAQTMCGWQPAFGRWPQRCVEQPKRMEVKLKVLGGRI
jgi:hypothetical protein